jgi:hypothetical protein
MNLGNTTQRPQSRLLLLLALALAVLAAAALFFSQPRQGIEARHALMTRKARIVSDMRADLYAAAQSEKSAVLAETDQASQEYAAAAVSSVNRVARGLEQLQQADGADAREAALLRDVADSFALYRTVDTEVLALAVQNTNLKAQALSFGQAAAALADLERALAPLGDNAQALRALAETLRIQSLHAPHIMEKTGVRMDALERDMAQAGKAAKTALNALPESPEKAAALAAFARHGKITAEITRLSRQNTNVLSLALSLEHKTKVLSACAEALRALEEHLRTSQDTKATR